MGDFRVTEWITYFSYSPGEAINGNGIWDALHRLNITEQSAKTWMWENTGMEECFLHLILAMTFVYTWAEGRVYNRLMWETSNQCSFAGEILAYAERESILQLSRIQKAIQKIPCQGEDNVHNFGKLFGDLLLSFWTYQSKTPTNLCF